MDHYFVQGQTKELPSLMLETKPNNTVILVSHILKPT